MSQAIYDVGSQSFDPMWEEAYADAWRSDTYVEKIATPMCFWTVRLLDIFGKTCTVSVMVFACDCDCVVSSLVALTTSYIPTYIHTYLHTYIHTRSFTTSFVFPSFPVPAETIEAHFRKKLTCGVIRSFNQQIETCVATFSNQDWRTVETIVEKKQFKHLLKQFWTIFETISNNFEQWLKQFSTILNQWLKQFSTILNHVWNNSKQFWTIVEIIFSNFKQLLKQF